MHFTPNKALVTLYFFPSTMHRYSSKPQTSLAYYKLTENL